LPSVLWCVRILQMAHRSSSSNADSDIPEPELSTQSKRKPIASVRTVLRARSIMLHASPSGKMMHDVCCTLLPG
jgi:hypothetical protein